MATTLLDLFVLTVIALPLFFRIFLEVFIDDGYLVPIINEDFDESLLQYTKYPESWRRPTRPTPTVHADVPVKSSTNWLTPNLSATLIGSASEAVVVFLIVFLRDAKVDVKVDPYACGDLPLLDSAKKAVKAAGTLIYTPFMGIETTLKAFLRDVIIFVLFVDMRQKLLGVEDVVIEEDIAEAKVISDFIEMVLEEEDIFQSAIEYPELSKKDELNLRKEPRKSWKRNNYRMPAGSRCRMDDKRRQKYYGAKRRLIGN